MARIIIELGTSKNNACASCKFHKFDRCDNGVCNINESIIADENHPFIDVDEYVSDIYRED